MGFARLVGRVMLTDLSDGSSPESSMKLRHPILALITDAVPGEIDRVDTDRVLLQGVGLRISSTVY